MKNIYLNYVESFKGLSKDIWYLSFVSLVNRAGTMVIPFLSLYLTNDLNYNESQVKWVLVSFGIGSVLGSWIGGKLTDKFGFYKVMVVSLFITGINFILLQYITSFLWLCIGILITITIADTFRPAVMVSIKTFSKPENQTRSIGLLRLAINAGMGIGPTLAGLLIVLDGYTTLFWLDGLTCIIAIFMFVKLVKNPNGKPKEKTESESKESSTVYKDFTYLIFCAVCFLFGMAFFQLIGIFHLYYNQIFELNEFEISLILFLNTGIIVLFEMPMLNFLEKKHIAVTKYMMIACFLLVISFLVLYENYWIGILVISMILMTFGEMLGFPYTNKFALDRAKEGQEGSYMALYTVSLALAVIFCPLISMTIIEDFGYQLNWLFCVGYGFFGILLSYWVYRRVNLGK